MDGFGDSRNVVPMAGGKAEAMRFPMLQNVESYWDSLRGPRPVPCRAEINPRQLRSALSSAFILERLAVGVARFRLAGSHLNDLMGMEVRGMPLTCFFLPEARRRVGTSLEQVFDAPAKAWLTLTGDRGTGKPPLDACLLLLPLRGESGRVDRALGCLATLGPVGRAPRRFDVRSATSRRLLPDGTVQTPEMARDDRSADVPAPIGQAAAGFAEPARGFSPSPHRPPRTDRPHLYLVKTDEM